MCCVSVVCVSSVDCHVSSVCLAYNHKKGKKSQAVEQPLLHNMRENLFMPFVSCFRDQEKSILVRDQQQQRHHKN